MKTLTAIVTSLFLMSSLSIASDSVKLLELPKEGIEILEIDCGAGFLKVTGIENLDKIEVKAEIEVDIADTGRRQDFIKDKVRLSLEKRGKKAVLISEINNSSFFSPNAHINLTVRIPHNMDLSVDDGSGFIEINDIVGNLYIEDGSGDMDIGNIVGEVEIDDGSGELTIRGVQGSVIIEDGTGEIDLRNVDGNIDVVDGSGALTISDITGNVVVRDGSGSIDIDNVERNVTIKEAGSGGVSIQNVKGTVTRKD